jgi:DNA-directed RNA polymerase beta' subunit
MIAGVQDKDEELKRSRKTRAEKRFEKYLEKAEERNAKGWFRADGSVLCKTEWVNSISKITTEQRNELRDLAMKG